jgi:hypothetical protein
MRIGDNLLPLSLFFLEFMFLGKVDSQFSGGATAHPQQHHCGYASFDNGYQLVFSHKYFP